MESQKIYEASHEELIKIKKSMSTETFSIDTTKLDADTKNLLLQAINSVVSQRIKDTEKVILGVR